MTTAIRKTEINLKIFLVRHLLELCCCPQWLWQSLLLLRLVFTFRFVFVIVVATSFEWRLLKVKRPAKMSGRPTDRPFDHFVRTYNFNVYKNFCPLIGKIGLAATLHSLPMLTWLTDDCLSCSSNWNRSSPINSRCKLMQWCILGTANTNVDRRVTIFYASHL